MKLTKDNLYQTVDTQYQAHKDSFEAISDYIFRHPEVGGEEIQSATYLTQVLKKYGFSVSNPAVQLPTAFMAQYGPGTGLTIAFVAEYDALPGFGPNGGPGHACGHNWIAATMCACAICMRDAADKLGCRIQVIGAPAEETFGAKYDLIQAGVFQGVDFVFQAHLDEFNSLETLSLAMNSLEFVSTASLPTPPRIPRREQRSGCGHHHVQQRERHAPAAPPERPRPRDYYPRRHGHQHHSGVCTVPVQHPGQNKVIWPEMLQTAAEIAEGASLAPGAGLKYRDYENPFDDMINVKCLTSLCRHHFEDLGIEGFVPEEQYPGSGSSDIGNVSYICPTVYCEIALEGEGDPVVVHEKSALSLSTPPAQAS